MPSDNTTTSKHGDHPPPGMSKDSYDVFFHQHPQPMWIFDEASFRFLDVNHAATAHYGYSKEEFLQSTIADIRPPEDIPRLRKTVAGPPSSSIQLGLWQHYTQDGRILHVELTTSPILFQNRQARLVIVNDVTERILAEQKRAFHGRQQAGIKRLSERALAGIPPAQLRDEAASLVATTCDVEYASVLELLPTGDLTPVATHGWNTAPPLTNDVDRQPYAHAAYTLVHEAPVIVHNFPEEQRFHATGLHRDHGVMSGVSVIIGDKEEPWGVLGAHCTRARSFSEGEVDFLQNLADVLVAATTRWAKETILLSSIIHVPDGPATENRLRRQNALLRIAGQAARLGGWSVTLADLDRLYWSDEVCDLHEVAPGFVPSAEEAFDFFIPEDRKVLQAAFETCANSGVSFDIEAQIITARKRRRWVRVIGEADRDADGAIRRVHGALQDISRWKRNAQEAVMLTKQLTDTLENITDGFFTVDGRGRFTYLNEVAELILERTRGQLLGRPLAVEFPGIEESIVTHGETSRRSQQKPTHIVQFYPPLQRWVELHAYPTENGTAVYLRDITHQHRAREKLRISEERFRLLSNATNDAIWDWDLVTDRIWHNEGLERMLGLPPGDSRPLLDTWYQRIHADDRQRVLQGFYGALTGSTSNWADEYSLSHTDGTLIRVLDRAHILRDDAGKPIRMSGGITDLTERIQAEEKLADQAALIEQTSDGILVRSLDHKVLFWNQGAEKIYGWRAEEVRGKSVLDFLYQAPEALTSAMQALLEDGEWSGELQHLTKRGTVVSVFARWSLLRNKFGEPKSVLSSNTDISERKSLEQQFFKAQRMESIGTLAGGIAHDLNNVLTPILMSISYLKMTETDPERLDALEMIESSAERGADMVKQILSFARGVQGRQLDVDAHGLLMDVAKIARETFRKDIRIVPLPAPDLWTLTGDPTQIHQVLLNLCVNARDAMPQGGNLTLAAQNMFVDESRAGLYLDAKPGPYVVLQVDDDGTGMPQAVIDRIFEPFFTTKEMGEGTGLGLSTAQAIIKSHGGFLHVYSEPERGSSFHIYLPAQAHHAPDTTASAAETLPVGHGETVLVVDDEYTIRQLTRQTLKAFGYNVMLASDGDEALSVFMKHERRIDIVLTDLMMPGMDGATVIQALRSVNSKVPIIAASGLSASASLSVTSATAQHFLPKPYTAATLLGALRQVLAPKS